VAAVAADDLIHQIKAKSGTGDFTFNVRSPIELSKDNTEFAFGNAHTLVVNSDHEVGRCHFCGYVDLLAFRSVLNSVGTNVFKD